MHLSQVLVLGAAAAAAAALVASVGERDIAPVNMGTAEEPHWVYGPPPGPVNMGDTADEPHWVFPPAPKPAKDEATPEREGNEEHSLPGWKLRRPAGLGGDSGTPRSDWRGDGPAPKRLWPGPHRRNESSGRPKRETKDAQFPPQDVMLLSAQRAERAFNKQCDRLGLAQTTLAA